MNKRKSIVKSPKDIANGTRIISTAIPDEDVTSLDYRFKHLGEPEKLELDVDSLKPQKTRTEYYKDLEIQRLAELEDAFVPASLLSRAVAGLIDLGLSVYGCYYLLGKFPQIQFNIFKLPLKNTLLAWYLTYVVVALIVSVLPLIIFQTTLGKRIMRIRVRGYKLFTLNIFQIIFRELVAKPIGLITLAGLYPIPTKKGKTTFHDLVARTRVIED